LVFFPLKFKFSFPTFDKDFPVLLKKSFKLYWKNEKNSNSKMLPTTVRIFVSYKGDDKKLISYSSNKYTMETFCAYLKDLFKIEGGNIALFQTGSDAEIVEPDFRDSDDFYIKVQSVSSAIQLLPTQEITINVEYLAKRLFNGETLLEEVNK